MKTSEEHKLIHQDVMTGNQVSVKGPKRIQKSNIKNKRERERERERETETERERETKREREIP